MQLTSDGLMVKKPGVAEIRGGDGWYHKNIAQLMSWRLTFFCCSSSALGDVRRRCISVTQARLLLVDSILQSRAPAGDAPSIADSIT
jgi:hypothetical protein